MPSKHGQTFKFFTLLVMQQRQHGNLVMFLRRNDKVVIRSPPYKHQHSHTPCSALAYHVWWFLNGQAMTRSRGQMVRFAKNLHSTSTLSGMPVSFAAVLINKEERVIESLHSMIAILVVPCIWHPIFVASATPTFSTLVYF